MKTITHVLPAALLGGAIALSTPTLAHDTEIYFSEAKADNDQNTPAANVLFLVDTSGSMCDPPNGGSRNCNNTTTPMVALRNAFSIMADSLTEEVKVGLAKFNGGYATNGYGGYVFYPVSELDNNKKAEVKGLVNNLQGTSNTPLMEAYTETARYMLGMSPTDYAERGEAVDNVPQPAVNVNRECTQWNNQGNCTRYKTNFASRYDSPINMANQCESNHIVVMTDGAPTQDTDYSSSRNITGTNCNSSYDCQVKLAEFLAGESPKDKKTIKTWQIGFGINQRSSQARDMLNVAQAGQTEKVYFADNAEELAQAFVDIMNLIDRNTRSIASPGVAVSQTNRFQNLDELYYAIFEPAENSFWEGNIKRYRMNHENQRVVDRQGNSAIETDTARFTSSSSSFWSTTTDGADITLGGAREQATARRLFYTSSAGGSLSRMNFNNPPDSEFFGLEEDQDIQRALLLEELKVLWGDPLHSEPLMVNYGMRPDGKERNHVFVSTNGGMLHAIDTENGGEKFAFMPYELISKANEFTINRKGLSEYNIRQTYGLDSSWFAWRQAGTKASDTPKKVYLYGGMRRGGDSYYALDVTNISSPKMLWQITPESSGFDQLGQTWSKPKLAYFPGPDGKRVPVIVFGGGYSPEDHDRTQEHYTRNSYPDRTEGDQRGNAIYAVNAETGELVWSASTPDMKWAIPGSLAVVDIDADGITDHLYFADLGGQVFRVDIDTSPSLTHSVKLIADLGGESQDHRRFYEQPTVAFVREGNTPMLYVTIGSGYRAHPKNTGTKEGIFVIKDNSALQPNDTVVANLSNLQNVTATSNIDNLDTGKRGWYYFLESNGEKSMSSPVVFNYQVMFTTYAPTEQDSDDVCTVRYGEAFLHRVDLRTGSAINIVDGDGVRRQKLDQSTPPPSPTILFGEQGETNIVIGTEVITDGPPDPERLEKLRQLRSGRWMQLSPDAAGVIRQPDI